MKFTIATPRLPVLLAFAASVGLSFADTVKTKDGTKYEGKIIAEDSLSVTIEVKMGGITDPKKISKANVVDVIRSTPDELAAADLKKLLPSEDGLSDAGYLKIITEQLDPFLKKFPTSARKAEVEAILKTYKEEMERAKKGEKKLGGEWITAEEQGWNQYNFGARFKRLEFEKLIEARDWQAAYQKFTELELEKSASVEYAKALALMQKSMEAYGKSLDLAAKEAPILLQNRTDAMKTMSADERRKVDAEIKLQESKFRLAAEEARKNKMAIPAFDKYDVKSIQDAQAAFLKEKQRLDKLDGKAVTALAEKFQQALKDLHDKAYISAARGFEAVAKENKDPFVKEQLAVAQKAAKDAASATTESSFTVPRTPAAAPKPAEKSPEAAKPKTPAKTEAGAPTGAEDTSSSSSEAPAEEEKSNMPLYLMGGAGALLLIGLIAKFAGKKKGGDD